MPLRAIIFDLYGTLLEVLPPPADAAARWQALWVTHLGGPPRLDLPGFREACRRAVEVAHTAARARGIEHPEVFWPQVVESAVPELLRLPPAARHQLAIYRADFLHSTRTRPEAAATLRAAADAGCVLGLASNCQPYTLPELSGALAPFGLDGGLFDPRLTFLSFEHGFSKPDPHVFQLLTARLQLLGIVPEDTLMVGDRPDHDLAPARAQGWQTCLVGPDADGGWSAVRARLPGSLARSVVDAENTPTD
ncbi:MAG: HAD family hydrolase [Verrucomicrobia bacterium]|nr:HAD family hydrolase [Verrucomicrobiota bacterium]